MQGDGGGWVDCRLGHRHWGRYGAAGLLLAAPDGAAEVILLQLRAAWSHQGSTWGLPGGARDSHESASEAALREATEETTLNPALVRVTGELDDAGCGWSYVTVLGRCDTAYDVAPAGGESEAVRWVPLDAVPDLTLHPRLAQRWPTLRAALG